MKWVINVPKSDKFDLYLNASVPANSGDIKLTFNANRNSIDYQLIPTKGPWKNDRNFQRIKIVSQFSLTEGLQEISLCTIDAKDDKTIMDIRSVELVPNIALSAIEEDYKKAIASRANSEWLSKAGYGLMFHWTSQSVNSDGSCKTYQDAVNDFDVNSFAKMVDETGAGYIIFTIGHAESFCPAPLKSWEKYHPGMTTQRDLIGEIADKLGEKGIKLMCYLPSHVVAKYRRVNDFDFMMIHTEILQEMGERYKEKIAGYWFDSWYQNFEEYPNVSFEEFFKATKAGNPKRLIALNSWLYPTVTPWQEYWTGEVGDPIDPPVNGLMNDGPAPDLRYHALLLMEPYWVQERPEITNPRLNSLVLSKYISDCNAAGGAVTVNMAIYQNGKVGEKALQVMKQVINLRKKESIIIIMCNIKII